MTRVLLFAVPVVLAVWALVDLVQTRGTRSRFMPRVVWVVAIIGIPIVGPVLWLATGVPRGKARGLPGGQPRPPRVVAPDDDPEFLRRLDAERLRQQRRRASGGGEASRGGAGASGGGATDAGSGSVPPGDASTPGGDRGGSSAGDDNNAAQGDASDEPGPAAAS